MFCILLAAALAITAEAGMMGPPPGIGGGPPGAMGMGPPPFVQAMIAAMGKPFGAAAGGPPMGPPPFVQSLIASKGMPFGGAAPQPEMGVAPAMVPSYVQSLLAAKSAGVPFMPPSIPLGPPPFVMQMMAAKAAQEAAMAQQLAAAQQAAASAATGPAGNATAPPQPPNINFGPHLSRISWHKRPPPQQPVPLLLPHQTGSSNLSKPKWQRSWLLKPRLVQDLLELNLVDWPILLLLPLQCNKNGT